MFILSYSTQIVQFYRNFSNSFPTKNPVLTLLGLEPEKCNFRRAADAKRKPTSVARVHITCRIPNFHHAACVFKNGKKRKPQDAELTAMRMTGQRERRAMPRTVVDEFWMVTEQDERRPHRHLRHRLFCMCAAHLVKLGAIHWIICACQIEPASNLHSIV